MDGLDGGDDGLAVGDVGRMDDETSRAERRARRARSKTEARGVASGRSPGYGLTYIFEYANLASMNLEKLQSRVGAAETLLKAMASPAAPDDPLRTGRRRADRDELQQAVGIAMSAVSQHLARLRDAAWSRRDAESQTIHYSLASDAA